MPYYSGLWVPDSLCWVRGVSDMLRGVPDILSGVTDISPTAVTDGSPTAYSGHLSYGVDIPRGVDVFSRC